MSKITYAIRFNPESLPRTMRVVAGALEFRAKFAWNRTNDTLRVTLLDAKNKPIVNRQPLFLGRNSARQLAHPTFQNVVLAMDAKDPLRTSGPYTKEELGRSVYPVVIVDG